MINHQWLELPMSQRNFHGPKDVRAIEVRLYFLKQLEVIKWSSMVGGYGAQIFRVIHYSVDSGGSRNVCSLSLSSRTVWTGVNERKDTNR